MTKTATKLPTKSGGYEATRFNALRHGLLSRYTVLPWEDGEEYRALLDALVAEHRPEGPTEEHLVEELAGILWRKRRLRLAEGAAYRRGLERANSPDNRTTVAALAHLDVERQIERVVDAIQATADNTAEELAALDQDQSMTAKALDLLRVGKADAYSKAIGALRDDTRAWWEEALEPAPDNTFNLSFGEVEEPYTADAAGLLEFLEGKVIPWYETRRKELQNRPLIRDQAFGEALDSDRLEALSRYEVHLDRKLERTLTVLFRLKELRRAPEPSSP